MVGLEEVGLALAACVLEHLAARPRRVVPPLQQSRRSRDMVFTALEHIERTPDEEHSLSEVARVVGLSPFHFLRLFRRETGVTPHRFLMQTRVRKAVALLRETSRPVTEIAFAVGFGDLSNFINFFKTRRSAAPPVSSARSRCERRDGSEVRACKARCPPAVKRKIYQAVARPLL